MADKSTQAGSSTLRGITIPGMAVYTETGDRPVYTIQPRPTSLQVVTKSGDGTVPQDSEEFSEEDLKFIADMSARTIIVAPGDTALSLAGLGFKNVTVLADRGPTQDNEHSLSQEPLSE